MNFSLPERPSKGLDLLKVLDEDGRIAGHYRLDAVRTHLLDMVGDHDGAIMHYRDAAARTTSSPGTELLDDASCPATRQLYKF